MEQHQRLAVRTYPKDGGSLTAVFDLSEARPVVEEVQASCMEGAPVGEAAPAVGNPDRLAAAQLEKKRQRLLEAEIELATRQLEKEHLALLDAGRMEYIAQIKDKIERNWLQPPGTAVGLSCLVRVSQIPGGEVVQAEIRESSGNIAFDRSVEEAVLRSSPLPVPKDPSLFDRHIVIAFEPEA